MAKKSTAARSSGAGRRPQTTAKNASRQAMLVRTPEMVAAGTARATPAEATTTQPQRTGAPNGARPAATSTTRAAPPKTTVPASPTSKVAARPAAATTTRGTHANRAARAQAVQRARAVNLITAEHYAYVINDLKLTGILVAAMFLVIIILHFVLG